MPRVKMETSLYKTSTPGIQNFSRYCHSLRENHSIRLLRGCNIEPNPSSYVVLLAVVHWELICRPVDLTRMLMTFILTAFSSLSICWPEAIKVFLLSNYNILEYDFHEYFFGLLLNTR